MQIDLGKGSFRKKSNSYNLLVCGQSPLRN